MATLHGYILRELLKTFALALIALTVLFTMGGGLYNIVRYEGVTTADIARLMPLMLPSAITFLMPVAALFAATMVYGRLAADNELTACRASGINVHRLFLSAGLLSIFVTLFTLYFGNFVIPDVMKQLDRFVRSNLRDIAAEQLKQKGRIRYPGKGGDQYFVTAQGLLELSQDQLRERGFDDSLEYLAIADPMFLQVDANKNIARYVTARLGLCQFDTRTTPMRITLYVHDGWEYSPDGREVRIQQQVIGPIDAPTPLPLRPDMVDLTRLLLWQREPWMADDLATMLVEYRKKLTIARFFTEAVRIVAAGEPLTLVDAEQREYVLKAGRAAASPKGIPLFDDVRLTVGPPGAERPIRYEAPRAQLKAYGAPDGRYFVELRLERTPEREVREYNPRSGDYATPRPMDDVSVDGAQVPAALVEWMRAIEPPQLLEPASSEGLGTELSDDRIKLSREVFQLQHKVSSVIHFRLSVAISALVTVLMGAILGVIFRGARLLAAFGLAAIPLATVLVVIVMGRQLILHAGTENAGVAVTWLGLVALGLFDLLLMRLAVRR